MPLNAIDQKCTPRIKAQCSCLREPSITIYIVDYEVWLANSTDSEVTLAAGDLFGFGVGSFKEIAKGAAMSKSNNCGVGSFRPCQCPYSGYYCVRYLI